MPLRSMKKLNQVELIFSKTLLLAPRWIHYSYSQYRLSYRFLYKRFKYFYKDFHRIYCFLPFIPSPSPSLSLTPVCISAKSLDLSQMSSHCLPTVAASSFSQLLHPCIPFSLPQHPGFLHTSFLWSCIHSCFLPNFPVALCCPPPFLLWPCHPRKHTVVSKHNHKEGSAGLVSFNQRWSLRQN